MEPALTSPGGGSGGVLRKSVRSGSEQGTEAAMPDDIQAAPSHVSLWAVYCGRTRVEKGRGASVEGNEDRE